jgi:hypothetical protein
MSDVCGEISRLREKRELGMRHPTKYLTTGWEGKIFMPLIDGQSSQAVRETIGLSQAIYLWIASETIYETRKSGFHPL